MKDYGVKVLRLKTPRLDFSAGDLLAATTEVTAAIATRDAAKFVREALKNGPMDSIDLLKAADAQGLSRMAIWTAVKLMGVIRNGGLWSLPEAIELEGWLEGTRENVSEKEKKKWWRTATYAANAEPFRASPKPPCPSPPPEIPPAPHEPGPTDPPTQQDDGSWTHAMPEVAERQKTDPHWYAQDECLYRGNLYGVQIDDDAVVDQEELNIKVKHFALYREQHFKRLRREIETFENLGRVHYRETIAKSVQMFVWQRDQGKCVQCGRREGLEFDHIIPIAEGGSSTERNVQLLCEHCNRSKGKSV